jgi:fructose-1,6-bisphosphatase
MAVRAVCSEEDGLVYFDGSGLKDAGEYCVYIDPTTGCSTIVAYFNGTGILQLTTSTPEGSTCPNISNALFYDGSGLKAVSQSGTCVAPG